MWLFRFSTASLSEPLLSTRSARVRAKLIFIWFQNHSRLVYCCWFHCPSRKDLKTERERLDFGRPLLDANMFGADSYFCVCNAVSAASVELLALVWCTGSISHTAAGDTHRRAVRLRTGTGIRVGHRHRCSLYNAKCRSHENAYCARKYGRNSHNIWSK